MFWHGCHLEDLEAFLRWIRVFGRPGTRLVLFQPDWVPTTAIGRQTVVLTMVFHEFIAWFEVAGPEIQFAQRPWIVLGQARVVQSPLAILAQHRTTLLAQTQALATTQVCVGLFTFAGGEPRWKDFPKVL